MNAMYTSRLVKERQTERAVRSWKKHGQNWKVDPVLQDGEVLIQNLRHGPNLMLFEDAEFPRYPDIRWEHIYRGLRQVSMQQSRDLEDALLDAPWDAQESWSIIMEPMFMMTDMVDKVVRTVMFLKDVVDPSPQLLEASRLAMEFQFECRKRTHRFDNFLPHFKKFLSNPAANQAQRRCAASLMLQFEHDGVQVFEGFGHRVGKIDADEFLQFLRTRNHIFNVSHDWDLNIRRDLKDKAFLLRQQDELVGIPQYVLADAANAAVEAGYPKATADKGPWMFTFDDAMLDPMLKHAKGRTFREYVYAGRKRVAFLGGSGMNDNTQALELLLELRGNYSNLIGYPSYADMSFQLKMATKKQAYAFLGRLRRQSLLAARRELGELQAVAQDDVDHFDVAYWRERLIEQRFGLREDYVREFFGFPSVLEGVFGLLKRLFGVEAVAADEEAKRSIWHDSVRFFRLRDASGELIASVFVDAYRRRGSKKPGFFVHNIHDYSVLRGDSKGPRLPAVSIILDIAPPGADGRPHLLTMDEVSKVFHTFGSALRHLFCRQREGLVAGIQGVESDALPLAGYLLERFAWEENTIRSMSRHIETGDPLPEAAIMMLAKARNFHNGMRVLKRTALAQIDLDLHAQYDPAGAMTVIEVAQAIEAEFSVIPPRVEDHDICSMAFNDDTRAGAMYGDLWGEALAADAFAEFEAAGLDDDEAIARVGRKFWQEVLLHGGGRSPTVAFRQFLGRPPMFAAFLTHLGIGEGEDEDSGAASTAPAEDNYEDVFEDDNDYVEFEGAEEFDYGGDDDEDGEDERPSSRGSGSSPAPE